MMKVLPMSGETKFKGKAILVLEIFLPIALFITWIAIPLLAFAQPWLLQGVNQQTELCLSSNKNIGASSAQR